MGHPNTLAALVTTGLSYILLKVSYHYDWLHMSSVTSLLVAGAIISSVLFIGRRGVWPTLKGIWFGASKTVSGPAEPKPPAAV